MNFFKVKNLCCIVRKCRTLLKSSTLCIYFQWLLIIFIVWFPYSTFISWFPCPFDRRHTKLDRWAHGFRIPSPYHFIKSEWSNRLLLIWQINIFLVFVETGKGNTIKCTGITWLRAGNSKYFRRILNSSTISMWSSSESNSRKSFN